MSHDAPKHHRITQLDGLRACAVLAVFLTHAFKIRMLWIGVDLFFVLSGFLITGILVDMKHKDLSGYFSHFYQRRALRILPPYLMILCVVSLFFGVSWMRYWFMYLGLTNYVVLLPGPSFSPLNPLWSLGVEEQFYLVWPFAVYFVSEKKLPFLSLTLIVLAPIFRVLAIPYDHVHQMVYMGTPFRMDCLAMGSLLTFVWRRHGDKIRRFGYLGLIPTILTPLVMMKLAKYGGWSTMDGTIHGNIFTYEIALCAATGAFVWALGGRFVGILQTAPFQFLGRISYTFYLVHLSTILLIGEHVANRYAVAALAFALTVAYATLSWYFVERPMLALGSGRRRVLERDAATHTQ